MENKPQTQQPNSAQREQKNRRSTIYDVAEQAGVAISTVSRVLNNSRDVSEATRERVLQSIEELQFRPDRTAKALAQRNIPTLAIAVPTFTTPFHNELLKGVRNGIQEAEVELLVYDLSWRAPGRTLRTFLKRGAVDGLLIAGLPIDDDLARELRSVKAPIVLIGHEWHEFDSFFWDDIVGVRLAIDHLVERGHTNIAMILPHVESAPRNARLEGFKRALAASQLPFDADLLANGETEKNAGFSEEAGYEAMEQLLKKNRPISAVFACSDVQAIGAWKALRDHDLRVPRDIALIGYDDIKTSHFIGLSSVAQHMLNVGEAAADVLLKRLQGDSGPVITRQIAPELCVRETT